MFSTNWFILSERPCTFYTAIVLKGNNLKHGKRTFNDTCSFIFMYWMWIFTILLFTLCRFMYLLNPFKIVVLSYRLTYNRLMDKSGTWNNASVANKMCYLYIYHRITENRFIFLSLTNCSMIIKLVIKSE
jgi:hypothetical protein